MPHDVFISYRRESGEHLAGRVKDALEARGLSVFMDVEDLKSGKFNAALLAEIEGATDFLVILTPGSLDRCKNESDWLRLEIRHAIKCKRNIVPIVTQGFQMPLPEALPSDIAELVEYNGPTPSSGFFDASMDRLVSMLLSRAERPPRRGGTILVASLFAVALVLGLLWWQRTHRSPSTTPEPSTSRPASGELMVSRGKEYFRSGNYQEALKFFRQAAAEGNPEAQGNLGMMYLGGFGVTADEAEAVGWYRKAAEQGYIDAQWSMGNAYFFGRGVAKSYPDAERWFRAAAEQGHARAQNNLATLYFSTRGKVGDYSEAVKWWRRAAEAGLADAQNNLGQMYENGLGVAPYLKDAEQWYRRAANQGHEEAIKNLANLRRHN